MRRRVRKRWGQHFLSDTNLLKKIARIINPQPHDSVLEIGPGEGALTELIAPHVKELVGVEIDRDLFGVLTANLTLAKCTFINQDFLELDITALPFEGEAIRVIGNIPYNITSPIIFKLLDNPERWADIHLMVQKEVAERLTASVGNRTYGRMTVMVQVFMDVRYELTVPPEVFIPRPKINSAVVSLKPHGRFEMDNDVLIMFRKIVRLAFGQRRKMLKNSLNEMGWEENAPLDLTKRPEEISVAEFMDLARFLM